MEWKLRQCVPKVQRWAIKLTESFTSRFVIKIKEATRKIDKYPRSQNCLWERVDRGSKTIPHKRKRVYALAWPTKSAATRSTVEGCWQKICFWWARRKTNPAGTFWWKKPADCLSFHVWPRLGSSMPALLLLGRQLQWYHNTPES